MNLYKIILVLVVLSNIVDAGSMSQYLQQCNFNTYCERFENNDNCPDDCPKDETAVEIPGEDSIIELVNNADRSSQIISNPSNNYITIQILSIVFVAGFLVLLILLYSWIHGRKLRLKKNAIKEKDALIPKPERRL